MAMSKKTRRSKGKSRGSAAEQKRVEAASQATEATDKAAEADSAGKPESSKAEPASSKPSFHSLVPSTDDIDNDWGSTDDENADADNAEPAAAASQALDVGVTASATQETQARTSSRPSARLRPSVSPAPAAEAVGPLVSRPNSVPPRPAATEAPASAAPTGVTPPRSARTSTPPPTRSLTPSSGLPAVEPKPASVRPSVSTEVTARSEPAASPVAPAELAAPAAHAVEFSPVLGVSGADTRAFSLSSLKPRTRAMLAAAWLATAVIPALAVYLVMRQPRTHRTRLAAAKTVQYEATAATVVHATPSAADSQQRGAVPEVPASAEPPDNGPDASTSTAPATIVVSESRDRTAVLITSRPMGARIYRRGKEIGRTPVTLEIGRGEHRVFEIGVPGASTRRISIDGEKPEIEVNLMSTPKLETVQAPVP
jgi:ribonuclease E